MGSTYQFEPKILEALGKIKLSPIEQRYIASCDCTDNQPDILGLKERFERSAKCDADIEVDIKELYPLRWLTDAIIRKKVGAERSVQDYFEAMDGFGHNRKIHNHTAEIVTNPRIPQDLLASIIQHADNCSVELAEIEGENIKVYSIFGKKEYGFDTRFVKSEQGYFTTHGNSESRRIAIRALEDEERINALKGLPELWKGLLERLTLKLY